LIKQGEKMKKIKKTITFTLIFCVFSLFILFGQSVKKTNNKKKGIRIIYLIRHGQYNHKDKRSPFMGKGLVPLGIAQARLVATRLKSLGVVFSSLYSSTMTRAKETAMVINKDFPYLKLKKIRIISECTPTTRRLDIMKEVSREEVKECEANLDKAFNRFFIPSPDEKPRYDIIVCHGNVIRYFITKILQVDAKAWLGMSIGNCSLTGVRIKPDGSMKLLFYGDVGHIPVNLQTGLYNKTEKLKIDN
jgi:serine/threonine-protein phosphatase PGAM5